VSCARPCARSRAHTNGLPVALELRRVGVGPRPWSAAPGAGADAMERKGRQRKVRLPLPWQLRSKAEVRLCALDESKGTGRIKGDGTNQRGRESLIVEYKTPVPFDSSNRENIMSRYLENVTFPHIRRELNTVLAAAAFEPFENAEWVRYWGWKADNLYITVDTKRAFSFNCQIWAAPWPENDELGLDQSFDCVTLPWALGKADGEFKVPVLPMFRRSFQREIVDAVKAEAMQWFDRRSTPTACLDGFRSNPNRNVDSPAFRHLARYVASLPAELENVACLVDPPVPPPDDYHMALFVPPSRRAMQHGRRDLRP
jgi:hypothetical protein